MEKKAWEKPQLIILSRGRSEERVLSSCSIGGGIFLGADLVWFGCFELFGDLCDVLNCQQPGTS
jgi:hypothetical protein